MEIRLITAQGLPRDITEEEIRSFVLLTPGEDGIKKIKIERHCNEARAKIYFLDPKAAEIAECFNGQCLRGHKVQIEEIKDPLELELCLLEKELDLYEVEAKAEPEAKPSKQKNTPATGEPEKLSSPAIEEKDIEETTLPEQRIPATSSASTDPSTDEIDEIPTNPKIQIPDPNKVLGLIQTKRPKQKQRQQWIIGGMLTVIIALLITLIVTLFLTQKSEEQLAANAPPPQKIQQLEKQIQQFEKMLNE